ncbi:MAG: zinc metallopeptidase [Phycisphaerales bacterium]|nr:zinc metallopeptidase [Phycisphaerales bacterium]MCB9835936.1 zinc metallopeptidase [Phycisphaera sp.]
MRWKGRRQSTNIEDRRNSGRGGLGPISFPRMGTSGRGVPGGKVALSGGSVLTILVIMALVWALGGNPLSVLTSTGTNIGTTTQGTRGLDPNAGDGTTDEFLATVLADTEQVWADLFAQAGRNYRPTTLVLFRGQTSSGCGFASAAIGPFYCPADEKIYIDLDFYDQLTRELGAPGDFAQAYVLAHEVGHHVQHLLGTTDQVHTANGRVPETEYNDLSVRLELQADFLAGVWAHHAQERWNILEPGDIEEAMNAAAAVGDDRLQKRSQGYAVPDSFTHGSSAQRVRWFRKGFESGDLGSGDTFSAGDL